MSIRPLSRIISGISIWTGLLGGLIGAFALWIAEGGLGAAVGIGLGVSLCFYGCVLGLLADVDERLQNANVLAREASRRDAERLGSPSKDTV
jgi:hypothetical protein